MVPIPSAIKKYPVFYTLLAIVLVGFILRVWNLTGPDMAFDDAHYSLRSIGYLDYVAAINRQSTPVTWFDEPQWWQSLSFHDAPPLVFGVQWLFFQIFGDNLFTARLPFVLTGLMFIYAIFLLGKKIAGPELGLIAAGALTVMNYAVWFSRIGWLDGFVALWVALAIYFFLEAKEKPSHYLFWGATFGAGVLTKYTFLFMGPVFLIALLVWQRDALRQRFFYLGIAVILILILPLIIYNIMMLQSRGHPDAAISTLIGQTPHDFRGLERNVETNFNVLEPMRHIFSDNFSRGLWVLTAVGLVACAWNLREKAGRRFYILVLLGALSALIMLSVVGSADRYGAVLLPFIAILVGVGILWLWQRSSRGWRTVLVAFIAIIGIWEFVFMAQTQWLNKPIFNLKLLLAANRPIFAGYNKLENYVNDFYKTFAGVSNIVTYTQAPQLAEYQKQRLLTISRRYPNKPIQDQLLVFDDRMRWFPAAWTFERRRLYDAAPIHSLTEFLKKFSTEGTDFYTRFGIKSATFIVAADKLIAHEYVIPSSRELGDFLRELESQTAPIQEIHDYDGDVIFKIFLVPLG